MSTEDKAREMKGKMKKTAGKAIDNKRMTVEGKAEEIQGKAGQATDRMRTEGRDHPAL